MLPIQSTQDTVTVFEQDLRRETVVKMVGYFRVHVPSPKIIPYLTQPEAFHALSAFVNCKPFCRRLETL